MDHSVLRRILPVPITAQAGKRSAEKVLGVLVDLRLTKNQQAAHTHCRQGKVHAVLYWEGYGQQMDHPSAYHW